MDRTQLKKLELLDQINSELNEHRTELTRLFYEKSLLLAAGAAKNDKRLGLLAKQIVLVKKRIKALSQERFELTQIK